VDNISNAIEYFVGLRVLDTLSCLYDIGVNQHKVVVGYVDGSAKHTAL
jgi:hypothetical protein